ncbi:putative 2-methoxy-6-polyprenyl-1,4-benzoquinol methylase [Helianthus annuus]|uniref:2-methoxy-6-polyprenyl-1,4-benzoquinol methylase n=1 Tax=Helianthus annuus TaxID=4232 RepID=A0A9K3HXN3_HELAN|nr:putative 2-methoxy-6-polyprenyl-1,4-benzoquinol methylase [Helianthus annuus]KAJ0513564.1 putative 2-methoxy-6-polyprenyl-1,4-benzoquinol methylase [Helianthus annuus]KAJ0529678.1 putative 2-methoxy-6-polyprenyl-1,4-benzoquinol methylase [Helianthus annuus]KAJ0696528.1 putative 2-methoxy-6-polyprenyl-1,4-benzoquinol methylase [Helianthus annuus]KAJ0742751.1 putative 2-methoxy-6-polyprenyl-1,4-benzoquinol methylase [Helianthus annuus]
MLEKCLYIGIKWQVASWKHLDVVSKLSPFPGMKHLDVAGGTGDVAFRILETINSVNRRAMECTVR